MNSSTPAPEYAYCHRCHGWVGLDEHGGGPTEDDIRRHRCLTEIPAEQALACHGRPDHWHECSLAARRWPQGTIPRGDEARHHIHPDYWHCIHCHRITRHLVFRLDGDDMQRIACAEHEDAS